LLNVPVEYVLVGTSNEREASHHPCLSFKKEGEFKSYLKANLKKVFGYPEYVYRNLFDNLLIVCYIGSSVSSCFKSSTVSALI